MFTMPSSFPLVGCFETLATIFALQFDLSSIYVCFTCFVFLFRSTGRTKKNVTVLEAAHSHAFSDRHFKFSVVVPDIL